MVGGAVAHPSASLPAPAVLAQAGQATRTDAAAVASLSLLFASTRRIDP